MEVFYDADQEIEMLHGEWRYGYSGPYEEKLLGGIRKAEQ